jgi:hypothetical protein
MMTVEFITALFYEVDEQLRTIPKHPEAHLWPSEVVTLGLLHALKGGGNRAFYRWLTRDYRPLFPRLPERTRLFRLFTTHHDWTQAFLAAPTVLGVIDTYGIELLHPVHEGRSPQQIGRKGLSNHRWIVGGKLCLLLNQWGLIVGWACATANVAERSHLSPVRKGHSRFRIWLRCSISQERNRSCTGGDNCNTIWTKCSVSKISKWPPAYTIICVCWVRSCSKASA